MRLGWPVVVKPAEGAGGKGASTAVGPKAFDRAWKEAKAEGHEVMVQEHLL
jgi:biotin carboxylase